MKTFAILVGSLTATTFSGAAYADPDRMKAARAAGGAATSDTTATVMKTIAR
jgi:hypothetical protein